MTRLFSPILAGASLPDRLYACLGALAGVSLAALAAILARPLGPALPWLLAPIGASAVLVFAVPASPLAQPWSVVGGNGVSALVGIALAHAIPAPQPVAAGVAVGAAILVMSLARCLHPPGGAMALTAVIGGPVVTGAGWLLPVPALLDSAALVLVGLAFHRWSGHSYPHRAVPVAGHAPALAPPIDARDIEGALTDVGEPFDIDPADLELLVRAIEARAAARIRPPASTPS